MKAAVEWGAEQYQFGQRAELKITVTNDTKHPILVHGSEVIFHKTNKKLKETHSIQIESGKSRVVWETSVTIGPWAEKAAATSSLRITYATKKGASWSGQNSKRILQGHALTITDATPTGQKIFVSHSNRDRDKKIVEETAQMIKKLGFEPYISERDRNLGGNLWKKIVDQILECDGLIFLITKDGVKSHDMREELGYARARNAMKGSKAEAKIVPIVERGVEPTGSLKGEKYEEIDIGKPSTVADRIAEIVTGSFAGGG